MTKDFISMEGPATQSDLRFLAGLCILALQDLRHISLSQCKKWHIIFRDVCETKGLLAGTSETPDGVNLIEVSPNVPKNALLETIAHEAVHLIQFMKGDAKRVGPNRLEWKGEEYQILPSGDPEYRNQPWEEEAHRLAPQVIANLETVPKDEIEKVRESFNK